VAAVTLATAAPPFPCDGLERQTRPAERRRLEELSICSSENFSSDGVGRALAAIVKGA
jgi:hypothetical protein